MKLYDLRCPLCGTMNRSFYLEETDGWMECEKCGRNSQGIEYRITLLIPLILNVQSRGESHHKNRIAAGS